MGHLQPVAGEIYSCYVKKLNKYGAYQILSVMKKSICYVTLDYLEEVPPTEEMLSSLAPLYEEMYRYHRGIAMTYTSYPLGDEGWLADNLTNPLRHWDGSEFVPQAAYKKVFSTYKNTKKLMQEADSKEAIVAVAMEYIESFNKLNAKYDEFIETEEREDIFMAMEQIYKECLQHKKLISLQELFDVMDGERDDW